MRNMYFLTESIAERYLEENGFMYKSGVYRLGDDKVIKKLDLDKSQSIYFSKYSESQLLQFSDIDIDGFSFAKALVYTKLNKVYGTISKYIDGNSLEEKPLSFYKIDDVIEAVKELEISIRKISDLSITVNDIHSGNMIFDGKKITMIDTTEYYRVSKSDSLFYDNMEAIMDTIFRDLFFLSYGSNRFATVYRIHKYFSIRKSSLENFRKFEYLMNPTETLLEIRKFMEEDFGVRLDTFGDSHKYIDNVIVDDFNSMVRSKKRVR